MEPPSKSSTSFTYGNDRHEVTSKETTNERSAGHSKSGSRDILLVFYYSHRMISKVF